MRKTTPLILAAIVLSGTLAIAGRMIGWPVTITVGASYTVAEGTLADTRAAAPTDAEIGCTVYAFATWSMAECTACTGGKCLYCSTADPEQVALVRSIPDDSELLFAVNNTATNGSCYEIMVSQSSAIAPRR